MMETETHIAVSPAGVAAVAWIAIPPGMQASIGYTFSADGGATWTEPLMASSPNGRDGSDPVLAVDATGGFYLSWVGYRRDGQGNPFDMHIYVAHAAAGATTFDTPAAVSAPDPNAFYDKPWIAVTNQGTAVVTYSRQSESGLALIASRSPDGAAWQESVIAEDPSFTAFRNLAYPCTPKTGARLWVTYPRMGAAGNVVAIELVHSDDQGATWSSETHVAIAPKEPLAYEDPACAADGNEVWISYGLSKDPPTVDTTGRLHAIRMAHSADGGESFDLRLDAHDPTAAPAYLLPAMSREDDGSLDLLYYAGDADGDAGALRRARMPAGAGAFEPSILVDPALTFNLQRGSPIWLGDYIGVASHAGRLYMAYATNESGFSHVAFASAKIP